MTDDIRALTAAIAADPASLLFLDLAERLRARRLLPQALVVAERGLERYPRLAAAHALLGRIRCDANDHAGAAEAWRQALACEPGNVEARKGLAYLDWRNGDAAAARKVLEELAAEHPGDAAIRLALGVVQGTVVPTTATASVEPTGLAEGTVLLDDGGMRLAGSLQREDGTEVSERVAAELAGAAHEAARTATLLGLGTWRSLAVEAAAGGLHVVAPTDGTLLAAVRDRTTPPGRLGLVAEQAARAARAWLEQQA
jgi:predicted regulator of Ras-like GTPase activity (Roadblock/LC7/MglB family)